MNNLVNEYLGEYKLYAEMIKLDTLIHLPKEDSISFRRIKIKIDK